MNETENSCEKFQDLEYTILAGVRGLLGLASLTCCLTIIVIILLFKRYNYFVQRLVLYVSITIAINSVAIAAQKVDYFTPNDMQATILERYCIFAGFLGQYTSLVELLSLLCITHGLYTSVIRQKPKKHLEAIYIGISLSVPFIISCIPFFGEGTAYGKSGPWCWIREKNQDDCSRYLFGIILQFSVWYVPLVLVAVVVICVYITTLYKIRKTIAAQWTGPYDPEVFVQKGRLRKVVKLLLAYLPVLYLIMNLFSLPNAIHWAIVDTPLYPLWVIHAIFPPMKGILFALPYLFHTDTRRLLKGGKIRDAVRERFVRKPVVRAYPCKQPMFTDSQTFPSAPDTTLQREGVYRNPSLSQALGSPTATSTSQENRTVEVSLQQVISHSSSGYTSTQCTYVDNNSTDSNA